MTDLTEREKGFTRITYTYQILKLLLKIGVEKLFGARMWEYKVEGKVSVAKRHLALVLLDESQWGEMDVEGIGFCIFCLGRETEGHSKRDCSLITFLPPDTRIQHD